MTIEIILLLTMLCYAIYMYNIKNKKIKELHSDLANVMNSYQSKKEKLEEQIIRLQEGVKRQNDYIEQKNAGNEKLHQDNITLRKLNAELESIMESTVKEAVAKARKDSIKRQRSILKGQATEHLAPYINSNYNPKDYKFLGDPIDYVIFDGMSNDSDSDSINKIVFMDIKTGKSQLNKIQKRIRKTILDGNIEFEIYRPEKDMKKEKED